MPQITFTTVGTTTTVTTQETTGTGGTPSTGNGVSGGSSVVPTNDSQQPPSLRLTNLLTDLNGALAGAGKLDLNAGGRLNDAQANLKEALKTLNSLISSLRNPDALAELLIEFSGLQRQQALDQRLASRDTAKAQLEGQAAETREAAVKEIASAAVALVMAVVSFAVSVGGAMKMGKELKEGMDAGKQASKAEKQMSQLEDRMKDIDSKIDSVSKQVDSPAKTKELNRLEKMKESVESEYKELGRVSKESNRAAEAAFKKADIIDHYTNAVNSLVKGLGEAVSGTLRGFAKIDEAQGQVLAANAEDTKADADALKSFMDAIDDLLRSALEFLAKMNDAEVELMASASRL